MREMTPAEIANVIRKIKLRTLTARASGKPVTNLIIAGGPLDGLALTMLDERANEAFVSWSVLQPRGPVVVMHKREGNTLLFTEISAPGGR